VHAWPEFFNNQNKRFYNITATWIAPNVTNWNIEFMYFVLLCLFLNVVLFFFNSVILLSATVVHKYDQYWTGIKSNVIQPTSILKSASDWVEPPVLLMLFNLIALVLFNFF
jgi:hypothetical protein